jgi:hypothetical protein
MVAEASAVSVLSNNIANSVDSSVILFGPVIVQGNTITGGQVGINFLCTADPNVRSNSINDVSVGIDRVPDTTVISNSYFNVPTIRQGGC